MNRRLQLVFIFLPLLAGIVLLFLPASSPVRAEPDQPMSTDFQGSADHIEPEKFIFLLQYLGTDYGAAIEDGQIISEFEYQEMLDFSQILLEQYERRGSSEENLEQLVQVHEWIKQKRDWDEVRKLTQELVPRLSREFNVIAYPTLSPNLDRGRRLYVEHCVKCHAVDGGGNGPSAEELDPPPRSFRDPRMNQLAPHQVFNAITFGVEGTDMPSHLESLSDQQRWDVSFYVFTFREGFEPSAPAHPLPLTLQDLAVHSNDDLISKLEHERIAAGLSEVDYYRKNPPGPSLRELLSLAERKLDQSIESYRSGETGAALKLTLDAYLDGIEPVEPALAQRNGALVRALEREFTLYRSGLRSGVSADELQVHYESIRELTAQAREALEDLKAEAGFAFVQSLAIILREGIEAALLVGLMLTYLAAAGYERLRKYVTFGAGTGVLLGILTWGAAQYALEVSPLQREALEGITSLLAAAVLFSVSFWVIHQVDIRHWKQYIQRRAEEALHTGSGLALASAAFLAVYREAVETVLFYEALWTRSPEAGQAILLGFGLGTVALGVLIFFMYKFGLRIPLKQFFAITGIMLGLLAFVFAGYGVSELQAIGWIKETPLPWMMHFPLLEVRPTLESSALQLGLLLSFLLGWFTLNRSEKASGVSTEARTA